MLVVFSSPTGGGKTEVTRILAATHNWRVVHTLTTRRARKNEEEKTSIETAEFDRLEAAGHFFAVDEFYGKKYGMVKADVEQAMASRDVFVIDRPVWAEPVFAGMPVLRAVLLPESEHQLIKQLVDSGRADRLEHAVRDYHDNYLPLLRSEYSIGPFELHIYNPPGKAPEVARSISNWVLRVGAALPSFKEAP